MYDVLRVHTAWPDSFATVFEHVWCSYWKNSVVKKVTRVTLETTTLRMSCPAFRNIMDASWESIDCRHSSWAQARTGQEALCRWSRPPMWFLVMLPDVSVKRFLLRHTTRKLSSLAHVFAFWPTLPWVIFHFKICLLFLSGRSISDKPTHSSGSQGFVFYGRRWVAG